MAGLFGVKPDYSTITPLKPADVCDDACHYIRHDNISVQSGTRNLDAWLDEYGTGPDTVWTYSQSSVSAMEYLSANPNDLSDQWYLLGTPEGFSLPSGDYSNVTFVVVEGDRVATGSGTLRTHINGYDNLDLNNPSSSSVDPDTGATTLRFDENSFAEKRAERRETATQRKAERREVAAEKRAERRETATQRRVERKKAAAERRENRRERRNEK